MAFASSSNYAYVADMGATGQAAKLVLEEICCERGGRRLFEGLNISLNAGDAAFVLGENGVGKSSLLRLVAGLAQPVSGRVDRTGSIALAGELVPLDADQTLLRALGYWAWVDHVDDGHIPPLLEKLGLSALTHVPVRMLSTGQRKRAGIAQALLSQADILLLDEPVNGLDAAATACVEISIADARARGKIILAATHIRFALPDAQTMELKAPKQEPAT